MSALHPARVLRFWLQENGPAEWYAGGDAFDAAVRARFSRGWRAAAAGGIDGWRGDPEGALAFLILVDQFPRNMFRGTARAFATDRLARDAAVAAIDAGHDLRIRAPERQFFYLPLEHSERIADQDRAVHLIATRLHAPETLRHARVHREVIRRYRRFPDRNAALGRPSTQAERAFLAAGGYGGAFRALQAAQG